MATLVLTTRAETLEASRRSSTVSTTASFQTAPLASASTSTRSRSSSVNTIPAPKANGSALGGSSPTWNVTMEETVRYGEFAADEAAPASPNGGGQDVHALEYAVHFTNEPLAKTDTLTPPAPSFPSLSSQPSNSTLATTVRQQPSRSYTTGDHVLAPLSTETAGTILSARPPRPVKLSQTSADSQVQEIVISVPTSSAKPSPDPATLLHPSSAAVVSIRPTRRNTTGSALPLAGSSKSGRSTKSNFTSTAPQIYDPDLDADIQRQAEQIRRERKQRELEEAEEAQAHATGKKGHHSRTGSAGTKSLEEWKPIVGNVVGEGHVNYILMYNMLTGIRVAVSHVIPFSSTGPLALTGRLTSRIAAPSGLPMSSKTQTPAHRRGLYRTAQVQFRRHW